MVRTRQSGNKRHSSSISTQVAKKRQQTSVVDVVVSNVSPFGRLGQILELGSTFIWDYLSFVDVKTLLDMLPGELSCDLVAEVSLKAIQSFAIENRTHLGRQCGCDWMRSLDFLPRTEDKCIDPTPYVLDENLPVFRIPGGARALLNALILTKELMKPAKRQGPRAGTFAPLICPLVSEKTELGLAEYTESDVKQVLNEIYRNSGTRFFKVFTTKRGRRYRDFLDYHWDGIKGSSCTFCTNLTIPKRRFARSKLREFEQIRSNCKAVYRPLKAAMMKNLQFARFVPRPRRGRLTPDEYYTAYEGLVAGITEDGILCGLYLVTGANYFG